MAHSSITSRGRHCLLRLFVMPSIHGRRVNAGLSRLSPVTLRGLLVHSHRKLSYTMARDRLGKDIFALSPPRVTPKRGAKRHWCGRTELRHPGASFPSTTHARMNRRSFPAVTFDAGCAACRTVYHGVVSQAVMCQHVPLERMTGVEPVFTTWKAVVLPLHYIRKSRRHGRPTPPLMSQGNLFSVPLWFVDCWGRAARPPNLTSRGCRMKAFEDVLSVGENRRRYFPRYLVRLLPEQPGCRQAFQAHDVPV